MKGTIAADHRLRWGRYAPDRDTLLRHYRASDVDAFLLTARRLQVHILSRRTNPPSVRYIGRKGFMPKPLDCKAKTADYSVFFPLRSECAGLVVDPTIRGFHAGFHPHKLPVAVEEWNRHAKKFALPRYTVSDSGKVDALERPLYLRPNAAQARGGLYSVDTRPGSAYFGCLTFLPLPRDGSFESVERWIKAGGEVNFKYVHADYDLYAIISADHSDVNYVDELVLHGEHNYVSTLWDPVCLELNRQIGCPMVQHGEQASFAHTDEIIDMFHADGAIYSFPGRAELMKAYGMMGNPDGLNTPATLM